MFDVIRGASGAGTKLELPNMIRVNYNINLNMLVILVLMEIGNVAFYDLSENFIGEWKFSFE